MGKCLSCCQDTNEVNQIDQSRQSDSNLKTEQHCYNDAINSGSSHPTDQQHGSSNNSGSKAVSSAMSTNSEKRTFYPRIPPILSSVSGENKRASQHRDYSDSKIAALFEMYKDPSEDDILSDGIEKFCQDLEVKPEDFRVLLLAWKFNASTMCKFTRQEFVNGCKALKAASIKGIQSRFPELIQEVQDTEKFKDLYRFTFRFGLDSEIGQRALPIEMAISLWKVVFSNWEPPLLERWLTFLEKHPNVRGIPRDTWNMFLNFLEAVGDDLSSYDDAEAWPSIFDDFVEFENDQTNQNVQIKEPTMRHCDDETNGS